MNARHILAYIAAVASLSLGYACAHDRARSDVPRYELQVVDEPERRRFLLVLSSRDKRDICVERGTWPDAKGRTETGRFVYSLRTERGTIFPHEPTVEIDCFDSPECSIRIRPGESLNGFIAYSEFGDPSKIRSLRKRELRADVVPSVCDINKTGNDKKEEERRGKGGQIRKEIGVRLGLP